MADYLIKGETLSDIADAIRTKKGTSDSIATSDFAEEIASIPGESLQAANPNLLMNADFRNPVNQRGQTIYINDDPYVAMFSIDRWQIESGEVRVNNGSISFNGALIQRTEISSAAEVYSISICVNGVIYTCEEVTSNSSGTFTGLSGLEYSLWVSDRLQICLYGSANNIKWIKVEEGKTATPFIPRSFVQEFAECRRYYYTYGPRFVPVLAYEDFGQWAIYFTVPIHTPFRTTPTVTIPNILCNGYCTFSHVEYQINYNCATICVISSEGSSPPEIAQVYGLIEFDAEIHY